jgi:hypothetical protein
VALAVYIVATYCAVKEHKEMATARLANAEDSVYRARRRRFIWRAGVLGMGVPFAILFPFGLYMFGCSRPWHIELPLVVITALIVGWLWGISYWRHD